MAAGPSHGSRGAGAEARGAGPGTLGTPAGKTSFDDPGGAGEGGTHQNLTPKS